jgi:hypothetical protein
MQVEGLQQFNNPETSLETEHETFRLAVQSLNGRRYGGTH